MKLAHETLQAIVVRTGANRKLGKGLLAIGPDVVCMGNIENVSAGSWTLSLKHFVIGGAHELVAFIDHFAGAAAQDRYILSKELGDGRQLSQAPSLTKQDDGYSLLCPVQESFPRVDVQNLGSRSAEHPETNDMFLDAKGNIARVAGLDALKQGIRSALSMQRGENVFNPDAGTRFYEYFENFKGSPWLGWLMTLDVIRQASIPYTNKFIPRPSTPLQCVSRVRSFELLSETPVESRVSVRVDFELQGLGPWQQELSIYMPTKTQMDERARRLAQRSFS